MPTTVREHLMALDCNKRQAKVIYPSTKYLTMPVSIIKYQNKLPRVEFPSSKALKKRSGKHLSRAEYSLFYSGANG